MAEGFIVRRGGGNAELGQISSFTVPGQDGKLYVTCEPGFTKLPNIIILRAGYCVVYTSSSSSATYSVCQYLEYNPSTNRYTGELYYGPASSSGHNSANVTYVPSLSGGAIVLTVQGYPKIRTGYPPKGTVGWFM